MGRNGYVCLCLSLSEHQSNVHAWCLVLADLSHHPPQPLECLHFFVLCSGHPFDEPELLGEPLSTASAHGTASPQALARSLCQAFSDRKYRIRTVNFVLVMHDCT